MFEFKSLVESYVKDLGAAGVEVVDYGGDGGTENFALVKAGDHYAILATGWFNDVVEGVVCEAPDIPAAHAWAWKQMICFYEPCECAACREEVEEFDEGDLEDYF